MPGTDRVEIRTLKVGRFCVVDEEAYKILSISKSKPGKHGSAKARLSLGTIASKTRFQLQHPQLEYEDGDSPQYQLLVPELLCA